MIALGQDNVTATIIYGKTILYVDKENQHEKEL